MSLQPGMIVTIYQDPLTCKKPEGDARLVKPSDALMNETETWLVEFSDGYKCARRIRRDAEPVQEARQ